MISKHIKLWTGFGSFSCVAAAGAAPLMESIADFSAFDESDDVLQLAQGGEGGEAGIVPGSYKLLSRDPQAYAFDVTPQVQAYADLVYESYTAAVESADKMRSKIDAFLRSPSKTSLKAARRAWVEARPAYLVTEVFRFYDGPIDQDLDGSPGPEPRINAWPLNEAFIDAVKGQPAAGIVNNPGIPMTRESILAQDQVRDESDVTTGWHAIEFLLWGQDHDPSGPGNRPHTDYLPGDAKRERRRLYLKTVTEILLSDLERLQAAWTPEQDNYRQYFLSLEPREALGRVINGVANLIGHEQAIERLAVALDSGDQEDEHSCFSDTTHQDHLYDLRGAYNVWIGSSGEEESERSLRQLVTNIDPAMAVQTDKLFAQAQSAVALMDQPFDSILRSEADSPARRRAENAISALQALGAQLARLGKRLGVLVIVPGLEGAVG